jgi:hypothetical protein
MKEGTMIVNDQLKMTLREAAIVAVERPGGGGGGPYVKSRHLSLVSVN